MAETATVECVHHWLLETPGDEVVRGRCKRCGAEREYPASVDGLNRWGTLEEAAAVSKSIELLPDADQGSGAGSVRRRRRPGESGIHAPLRVYP